ncbi:hypothetical protein BD410DRAFT_803100 [Rickenella mellea]|uniref:Uncharacterized protein n=1 Tax=Rickenella mellea TaxID=50990 RepID=A0A4Y7Q7H4_9AGAM|nr:hypothetical protein BD410DRAFT_803100 [Rickenella mellea]
MGASSRLLWHGLGDEGKGKSDRDSVGTTVNSVLIVLFPPPLAFSICNKITNTIPFWLRFGLERQAQPVQRFTVVLSTPPGIEIFLIGAYCSESSSSMSWPSLSSTKGEMEGKEIPDGDLESEVSDCHFTVIHMCLKTVQTSGYSKTAFGAYIGVVHQYIDSQSGPDAADFRLLSILVAEIKTVVQAYMCSRGPSLRFSHLRPFWYKPVNLQGRGRATLQQRRGVASILSWQFNPE